MDFLRYINTEHSTYTQAEPKQTIIPITKGLIVGGWIYFPSGPAGLLSVCVRRAKHQIFPSDQGQSYRLDDCSVPLFGNVEILQPPYQLTIETWNLSTTYDHALTVCIFIEPKEVLIIKRSLLSRLLNKND